MRSPLGAALLLHLFCHSFAGGSLSPSVTPASSEFPSSISSTSTLKKTRIPLDSTAHSVPGTPTAGPPPSSWNESSSSRAPFGSSSTAKNLLLVLLLVIAMLVLIGLIVLRFKCRNYRKQKREAKDITSQQSTAVRDQVTLISVRMTDTDAGSTINNEFL
ncbi:endothelial cell-specific chemotaxis regulator-like isoform X2 [Hemiscyllium ocellatum]|uniref:endothelial cell-specific chemotaxis regulator-like isoform X2 n=1 Tax=Hemiscyllium ocellatum TaxID=170820 RepID=UPI0029675580|nr:endothelial cell-specific chemotaxis regulator-like isoform X2 [Hemiscyllium ocellatum]